MGLILCVYFIGLFVFECLFMGRQQYKVAIQNLFVCLFMFPEWGDSSAYSIQTWTHQDATGSAGGWGWYCVFISLVCLFNECLFICLFVCLFVSRMGRQQTWSHQDARMGQRSLVCLFEVKLLVIYLFVCLFVCFQNGETAAYSIQTWTGMLQALTGGWGWCCVFISLVCLLNECLFICLFVCLFVSRMGR